MASKPQVFKGPANLHTGPDEAVYEISFGGGVGALLLLRKQGDGRHIVELYRVSPEITVRAPAAG